MSGIIELFNKYEYKNLINWFNKEKDIELVFYYFKSLFILNKYDVILREIDSYKEEILKNKNLVILWLKTFIITKNENEMINFMKLLNDNHKNDKDIQVITNKDSFINFSKNLKFKQSMDDLNIHLPSDIEYKVNILSDKIILKYDDLVEEIELFNEILPQKSYFKNNIITLLKKDKIIWRFISKVAHKDSPPNYPSSNLNKKNWDKVCKDYENEWVKNKEYDTDSTTHFFKQIYENSNPEARRAMMKSFQTSNGKVLSTNWNDVKNKDYEGKDKVSPPDGWVEKKWES